MHKLTLNDIFIYPIKSLGGIRLDRAQVHGKGLHYDRRWMLIDGNGVAITQRLNPEMALYKVRISGDNISIEYRKEGKVISSTGFNMLSPPGNNSITARVWGDEVRVSEVDRQLSEWFSRHLKTTCKLVVFPERNPRPVDPRYNQNNEHVSLADAYPFLIIGQGSLDDLNKRLTEAVPMNRFRPNFVFSGGDAFIEDKWRDLTIGKVRFMAVKKCSRCIITTVNQDTAEKGAEPLRTLTGYRKTDNEVYFGQNLIAIDKGEVSIGDPVVPG
jgi:uncharacterized protein